MKCNVPISSSGDLKPGWKKSKQSAASSTTYLSEDTVLQARAAYLFESWQARMQLLETIEDPNDLLIAARCDYWLDEQSNCFWVRYKRHDTEGSPCYIDFSSTSSRQIEQSFALCLSAVLETEELLRSSEISTELLARLAKQKTGKVHSVRMSSDEMIKDTFRALGYKLSAPTPLPGPVVLSHADVLLKNTILAPKGYRLIDWEALGLYRAAASMSHALSWTLLHLDSNDWPRFLQHNLESCLPLMQMTREDAILSIYWNIMREALYWSRNKQRFDEWMKRSDLLLNL